MSRAAVLPALATTALLAATLNLSGCAWFMKQQSQAVELTPEAPQADGRLAPIARHHNCWVELTYKALADGNFDPAPFKDTWGEAKVDASGSSWVFTGENRAGKLTRLSLQLADPALTVGTAFNVAAPGVAMAPPMAAVQLVQGVAAGTAGPFRTWTATSRAGAVEVSEMGPAARAQLAVDLVFAPDAMGNPPAKGAFSLKGRLTVYDLRTAGLPGFRVGAR